MPGKEAVSYTHLEDTVGKVSLPALKEDAALTVSFEQAEVEQEAQFPDDIEIVFSNAQDENTREVSEDGITLSLIHISYVVSLCIFQIGALITAGTFGIGTVVAFLLIIGFIYLLFRPYKESQTLNVTVKAK